MISLRRAFDVARWALARGREPQAFLGAAWVTRALDRAPASRKRRWALRLLSLSPHYFINPDALEYREMKTDEYLDAVFRAVVDSRVRMYDEVLRDRFTLDDVVLDYGCGPGVLAKIVAPHVKRLYACDISTGAIACARVLSTAPNLEYVVADAVGLGTIEDGSLDAVYSVSVVQHLSDAAYARVLEQCQRTLKGGGRLLLHIQLLGGNWRTEADWTRDVSLAGRLRFRHGLHCFGRTAAHHRDLVSRYGFEHIVVENLADMVSENRDEARSQALLTARRSPRHSAAAGAASTRLATPAMPPRRRATPLAPRETR